MARTTAQDYYDNNDDAPQQVKFLVPELQRAIVDRNDPKYKQMVRRFIYALIAELRAARERDFYANDF